MHEHAGHYPGMPMKPDAAMPSIPAKPDPHAGHEVEKPKKPATPKKDVEKK